MPDDMLDDLLSSRYDEDLLKLLDRLKSKLVASNEKQGIERGFILLMVRDLSPGNVDIGSMFDNPSTIKILRLALQCAIEKERERKP